MTTHHVKALVGFAIGGVFLYLAARHASMADVLTAIRSAKTGWLAVAVLLYWLELGARVMRWHALLLHTEKPVELRDTTSAFLIGYAANNVLPAKLGELIRIDLISRVSEVPRMSSLGTVVIERVFDMLLILLMGGFSIGLLVLPESFDLTRLRNGMITLETLTALLMVVGAYLYWSGISSRQTLTPRIRARLGQLSRAIRLLMRPTEFGRILALSLLIWALNGLAMWLIVFALGVSLYPLQTLLLMGVVGISAALPAPPAGLGVLQYAFALVFELLGKSSAIGLAASATVQLALLGSVTLVGAFLFFAMTIPLPIESRATDG
jgi:glycosyltransferase 2 family protein